MGGKIDCYVDIASFYSYIAFIELMSHRQALAANGVEVEFHPVLIAGIIAASKNQPPWRNPAKAAFLSLDAHRAGKRLSRPDLGMPTVTGDLGPAFVQRAMTKLAQRALLHLKLLGASATAEEREAVFEAALARLFKGFHAGPGDDGRPDLTDGGRLREELGMVEVGGRRVLEGRALDEVMAAAAGEEMREALRRGTDRVVAGGAFGLPWMVVRDGEGREEPFWGSDRFNHIYAFLGIPFQDVKPLRPTEAKI